MIRVSHLLFVAVILLARVALGAESFNGTTENGASSTVEVTGTPISMACWGKTTTFGTAISISDTAGDTDYFWFLWNTTGGNPIQATVEHSGTTGSATSTTGWTSGVWAHGAVVFASSTSRAAYINGGSKGTNATSVTPAGIDATDISALKRSSLSVFFSGSLAECGIWNVALTDDEVGVLAKGYAPPCVERGALVAYYPMVNDSTSLKDIAGTTTNNLTLTGGAVADHPPIIQCK
jgi:hypothetical protein